MPLPGLDIVSCKAFVKYQQYAFLNAVDTKATTETDGRVVQCPSSDTSVTNDHSGRLDSMEAISTAMFIALGLVTIRTIHCRWDFLPNHSALHDFYTPS